MNLLVSVAVTVVPEEKDVMQPDVQVTALASEIAPPVIPPEIPIEEVLAAETEEVDEVSVTPTPTETPTPTPTEIIITATPTIIPTATVIPTATPTPTSTSVTVTPSPTATTKPIASPVNLDELFNRYAGQYGVDVNLLKKIAKCESNFNTNAVGPKGLYVGMFQFGDGSWQGVRKQMGIDPNPSLRTNAEESIKTAAYAISKGRASMWPNCSK